MSHHAGPTPTVLIIDDETVNIMVLKGMLSAHGFAVLSATDGVSGRAMAKEHKPDIILLDIMMPGENGFKTCHALLQDTATTDIPVIFVSALADVESKVRGLGMGAVDYVTKPFEEAEVLARIRLHIKLKYAHRAIIEEQAAKLGQITEAQQSLLVDPAEMPEAQFEVRYIPILEAGGDFYDVFPYGKKSHWYFVSDICGHDLGASFVTSSLKALGRQNFGPLYTPLEGMKNMNSVLSAVLPSGRFITALGCNVNRGRQQLTLINAGHPPPVFIAESGEAEYLVAEGDVLGAFGAVLLEPLKLPLRSGDRLFLYTDGLVEFLNKDVPSLEHGRAELLEACRGTRNMPLAQAVDSVVEHMRTLAGTWRDDVVLMGIEV